MLEEQTQVHQQQRKEVTRRRGGRRAEARRAAATIIVAHVMAVISMEHIVVHGWYDSQVHTVHDVIAWGASTPPTFRLPPTLYTLA